MSWKIAGKDTVPAFMVSIGAIVSLELENIAAQRVWCVSSCVCACVCVFLCVSVCISVCVCRGACTRQMTVHAKERVERLDRVCIDIFKIVLKTTGKRGRVDYYKLQLSSATQRHTAPRVLCGAGPPQWQK